MFPILSSFLPCLLCFFFFFMEEPDLWFDGFPLSSFSLALPLVNKSLAHVISSWHLFLRGSGLTQMAWTCAGGCLRKNVKYANPAC